MNNIDQWLKQANAITKKRQTQGDNYAKMKGKQLLVQTNIMLYPLRKKNDGQ